MLGSKHVTGLVAVLAAITIVAGGAVFSAMQRVAPPPRRVAATPMPPGTLAEAAGLAIILAPDNTGLVIMTAGRSGGLARSTLPTWREVARLEPRILVGGTWHGAAPLPPEARPIVREESDHIVIIMRDLVLGDAADTTWTLTLSRTEPLVTLDRTDNLQRPREIAAIGLAVTSRVNRPPERLVLVNGTAYTLPERSLDRIGNHGLTGVVDRDPALTFTLDSNETTHAAGERLTDRDLVLLAVARPATSTTVRVQTQTKIRIGPRQPLQATTSTFAPEIDSFLLTAGYYGNIFVSDQNQRVLTASMQIYPDSVWIRDVSFASRGYLYVLDDAAIFRNTLVQFIKRTTTNGIVPEFFDEAGKSENRQSWDAMPDLIHGCYAYVSKTRDIAFVNDNYEVLTRVAGWIRHLDTNDDGLPDQDIFPYGYFDSVENGVMHTYAIASFYSAMLELAELAELVGRDGQAYREYAHRMRLAFNRPVSDGGYWQTDLGYPIAWKKADGRVVTGLETFGVLTALRSGLIDDADRRRALGRLLHERRSEFINQAGFGSRLMVGGYHPNLLRPGVTPENSWLLDANAPWLTGPDVAVRAALGYRDDAAHLLTLYRQMAQYYPPMPEFSASPAARFGRGDSKDGGRLWDNGAWFDAVYATHYGLQMTPAALLIRPQRLVQIIGEDKVEQISYQGMVFNLTLRPDGYSVKILKGQATLILYPADAFPSLSFEGGPPVPAQRVNARAGEQYQVFFPDSAR